MDAKKIITIVQIIISVLVIASVLIQNRGEGLGTFFGGGGEIFRTRRGIENTVYYGTIALSAALVTLSIVNSTL